MKIISWCLNSNQIIYKFSITLPSRACNKILIQTISFNWLIDVDETRLKLTTTRKQSVLLKILPTFKMQNIFLCNLRDYIYEQTSNFDGTVTFCLCKLDDKKYQRWTLYTNKSCQELLSIEQHTCRKSIFPRPRLSNIFILWWL